MALAAGTLVAQRLDVAQAALTGEPVTLADSVAVDGFTLRGAVSVAATGLLAYRTGAATQRQLLWFDRSGTARGTVGDPDGSNLFHPRVSTDGRRMVVTRTVLGNTDLWLLDGARASRVTFDAAVDTAPLWSPDGTRIVFRSARTGSGDLYQKLTGGAGVEERLVASDPTETPTSWSADGRFLLYVTDDLQTSGDLWVVPRVGDRTPSVFLKTPFRETQGVFSPDGRWVAYQSDESGRRSNRVRRWCSFQRASSAALGTRNRAGNTTSSPTAASSSTRNWTAPPRRSRSSRIGIPKRRTRPSSAGCADGRSASPRVVVQHLVRRIHPRAACAGPMISTVTLATAINLKLIGVLRDGSGFPHLISSLAIR